ncbi:hypothetical protein B0H15DRAFT_849868 [Mycena belliarum]|uniref:Uncharacterized protein n=1 Tax=Mycena belliarum TaxID=1033014 RepID=A0AAD6TYS7_9AGAR|nr:hypothetical protein B0H15DRAFT_849868 [Mycena belliae]
MSSSAYLPVALNVTGFFSLSNGVQVQSQCGGCHNNPPGDEPVKNGMIVFVVAKASFPSNGSAIMDAAHFASFPGDPAALDYEVLELRVGAVEIETIPSTVAGTRIEAIHIHIFDR